MRIRRMKNGSEIAAAAIVSTVAAPAEMNTPRSRVFIFPRSPAADSTAVSFITVIASANSGRDRKVANEETGSTAPIASCETNLGTNHIPAARFTASPARSARNSSVASFTNFFIAVIILLSVFLR